MWKLRRYLAGYKKELILGPAFKLTEAALELTVPLIMARIINIGVANRDIDYIIKMGFVLVLLGAVGFGSATVCQYFASVASQGTGTVLRRSLFEKITALSTAELDRFGTSRLTSALTGDIYALQYAVAMLIRLVIRAPFIALGAIVTSMIIDLRLSLIILTATPVLTLAVYLIMSRMVPFYRAIRGAFDRVAQITRENLTGTRAVRAFSKEEYERIRFRATSDRLAEITAGAARLTALLNPLTYVIINLGIAAVIWFGGFRVEGGYLTQGELIAFVNYMTQIMSAVIVTAGLVVTFTRASASAARINEIFDTITSVDENESAAVPDEDGTRSAIRFDRVTFGYGGIPALRDINLNVPRGSALGIVGGTGSGKSTLIRLVLRFYDADAGTVAINGINVRDMPLGMLRDKIGYVPQHAELLPGTIAENIRMGDQTVSDDDINEALHIAQADFVLQRADGIHTEIQQDGRGLSGGQRQRITIARALARNPEIFIFDDSFSALDTLTGQRLRQAIDERYPKTTKVIVSQRASSVKNADIIAVLEDGALAGCGTHAELIASCPVYNEIVNSGRRDP